MAKTCNPVFLSPPNPPPRRFCLSPLLPPSAWRLPLALPTSIPPGRRKDGLRLAPKVSEINPGKVWKKVSTPRAPRSRPGLPPGSVAPRARAPRPAWRRLGRGARAPGPRSKKFLPALSRSARPPPSPRRPAMLAAKRQDGGLFKGPPYPGYPFIMIPDLTSPYLPNGSLSPTARTVSASSARPPPAARPPGPACGLYPAPSFPSPPLPPLPPPRLLLSPPPLPRPWPRPPETLQTFLPFVDWICLHFAMFLLSVCCLVMLGRPFCPSRALFGGRGGESEEVYFFCALIAPSPLGGVCFFTLGR